MKIILIANTGFTITNFRSELISELIKEGHEVVVACPSTDELSFGECFITKLQELGAIYVPITLKRSGINPLGEIITIISLLKVFLIEKPDMVINYTIKPTLYSSFAAKICGVPHIFSNITGLGYIFTGSSFTISILRPAIKILYRMTLKWNTTVFFQNIDDASLLIENGILKRETCKIINGSGVNLEYFHPGNKAKKRNSFILVARLLKDKGISEYIEAAARIKKEFPNTTFTLLGPFDSNLASYKKEEIENWVSNGIVNYITPTKDVRPYLQESEVFVLPSYREGTPRSALEAMAMAMPIITTNAPGCRETVENGKNGILVNSKDVDSLYNAIRKLIDNDNLKEKMGKESLLLAQEKYDVRKVNESIINTLFKI